VAEVAVLFPDYEESAEMNAEPLREATRIAEALIFASSEPVDESEIGKRMPDGVSATQALEALRLIYADRGINLVRVARRWTFRTASDLTWLLSREKTEQKKLSRAALETLAIIAYHQPTTRAEIEDIRGVAISKGTLDVLLETTWVRLRGRRRAPGRPVTYGTTDAFLLQFGLETLSDLPGLDELKGAGLFDGRLPPGFGVPQPKDDMGLADDEDPLEDGPIDLFDDIALEDGEGADIVAAGDPAATDEAGEGDVEPEDGKDGHEPSA
jgi:segregation and condensation protein B